MNRSSPQLHPERDSRLGTALLLGALALSGGSSSEVSERRRRVWESAVQREHPREDEQQFSLYAGPLQRHALRADVLGFCERNGLSCDITERNHRLLSTEVTFRVHGSADAVSSLAGYLRWTGRSFHRTPT
jgi:hypothetical protein